MTDGRRTWTAVGLLGRPRTELIVSRLFVFRSREDEEVSGKLEYLCAAP